MHRLQGDYAVELLTSDLLHAVEKAHALICRTPNLGGFLRLPGVVGLKAFGPLDDFGNRLRKAVRHPAEFHFLGLPALWLFFVGGCFLLGFRFLGFWIGLFGFLFRFIVTAKQTCQTILGRLHFRFRIGACGH